MLGKQVHNTDGYFAVTAYWIKNASPTVLKLESALLVFTCLNNTHNGRRLGQALFKIVEHAGIVHKV